MAFELPHGHWGDLIWRLPLTRTLASMRAVTQEQVQAASALAVQGGLYATHLQDVGVPEDRLLMAWAVATGLPSAPRQEVRHPPPSLVGRVDEQLLRSLLAVPFAVEGKMLYLAFAVPPPKDREAALPPHRSYVGLEAEIRAGLDALYPRSGQAPDAGAAFPATAISAPRMPVLDDEPPPAFAPTAVSAPRMPVVAPEELPSLDFPPPTFPPPAAFGPPGSALGSGEFALTEPGRPPLADLPPVDALPPLEFDLPPPGPDRATDQIGTAFELPPADAGAATAPWSAAPPPPPPPPPPAQAPPPAVPLPPGTGAARSPQRQVVVVEDDPYAVLKGQLRRLAWPVAAVVALGLAIRVGLWVIDSQQSELERRTEELQAGIQRARVGGRKPGTPVPGTPPDEEPGPRRDDPPPPPRPVPGPVAPVPAPQKPTSGDPAGGYGQGTFESLDAALAGALEAAKAQAPEFRAKCRGLDEELRAFRVKNRLGSSQMAELATLNAEVDAACGAEAPPQDFGALRDRIALALRGGAAAAGPRWQYGMPPETVVTLTTFEETLDTRDEDAICAALPRVQAALARWAGGMPPGPRASRVGEVAGQEMDEFRRGCDRLTAEVAKARWSRLRRQLEPDD